MIGEGGFVNFNLIGTDRRWALFVPSAPASVTALPTSGGASVSWTAPSVSQQTPIVDYVVQYSSNSGSTWTTFADGVSASTGAQVTGLTNGTSYVFRVAAINAIGQSLFSTSSNAVIPGSDPYWAYVALLLHCDGASFVDSSSSQRTINVSGSASITTAQSKFGGASAYFPGGASDGIYFSDLNISTGDFALELFFKSDSSTRYAQLIGNELGYSGFTLLVNNDSFTGGQVGMYLRGNPTIFSSAGDFTDNQWHHVALSRSGSTLNLYLDGSLSSTVTNSTSFSGADMWLGKNNYYSGRALVGYIDEVRITVGSARGYTGSTITVPSLAFSNG